MSSKAEFRARREMLGLSQGDVAQMLNKSIKSIKRWENPTATEYPIPLYAFEMIYALEERFDEMAEWMLNAFCEHENGDGRAAIAIYRDAQHLIEKGESELPYGMLNAISYEVARELEAEGITVSFYYPGYTGEMVEVLDKIDLS